MRTIYLFILIGIFVVFTVSCTNTNKKSDLTSPTPRVSEHEGQNLIEMPDPEPKRQDIPDIDLAKVTDPKVKDEINHWLSEEVSENYPVLKYGTQNAAYQISESFKQKWPQGFQPTLGLLPIIEIAASEAVYGTQDDINLAFQSAGFKSESDYFAKSVQVTKSIAKSFGYLAEKSNMSIWVGVFSEMISQYANKRVDVQIVKEEKGVYTLEAVSGERTQSIYVDVNKYPSIDADQPKGEFKEKDE